MIGKQFNKDRVAFIYITLLTVIAVVYGFTIIPSPAKAQALAFDHRRVVDLGLIQAAIDSYYQTNSNLPNSLAVLPATTTYSTSSLNKTDPQTKAPYEYQITSDTTYKLCATFATDSNSEDPNVYDSNIPDYTTYMSDFKHPAGHHCFDEHETNYNYDTPTDIPTPYVSPSTEPINPTVALSSFDKNADCQWTPKFTLRGFSSNSTVTVRSQGTLSDNCDPSKTHAYSWTASWNEQTDANGTVVIDYLQNDYGDYTYTFTDAYGDTASIHFSYGKNDTIPTILP